MTPDRRVVNGRISVEMRPAPLKRPGSALL